MKIQPYFVIVSFLFGLFVAQTAVGAPQVTITENARKHFKAGVAYIDDPAGSKYEEAHREFRIAYTESPSYKILTNIGLCALNLERDGEAISAYEGFLAHATAQDIPADKRRIMERDIATLKASLVTVRITAEPESVTLIDVRSPTKGNTVTNRYELAGGRLKLGIHPGQHRITAQAAGFEPETWEFEGDSATSHEHTFKLVPLGSKDEAAKTSAPPTAAEARHDVTAPPEKSKKVLPTMFYVSAVTSGVFAVATGAVGAMAVSKLRDFDRANETPDNPLAPSLRREYVQLRTLVYVGGAATGAAAITAAALYFTAPTKAQLVATRNQLRVVPELGSNYLGVAATARF